MSQLDQIMLLRFFEDLSNDAAQTGFSQWMPIDSAIAFAKSEVVESAMSVSERYFLIASRIVSFQAVLKSALRRRRSLPSYRISLCRAGGG